MEDNTMIQNEDSFVIERIYDAPVTLVWKAITDKDQMKLWYFNIAEFKPEAGCEFSFTGTTEENTPYLHLCKITEVVPLKKLSYTWRYDQQEGNSLVSFELFQEGNKTKLKLTHTGLSTFPKHADFAPENFAMGWKHIIGVSLKEFVEKKSQAHLS